MFVVFFVFLCLVLFRLKEYCRNRVIKFTKGKGTKFHSDCACEGMRMCCRGCICRVVVRFLLFGVFVKTKGCSVVAEGGYKKRNRLFGGGSSRLSVFYYIVYSSEQVFAQRNSRFMRAMLLRFMLFGHSASQA